MYLYLDNAQCDKPNAVWNNLPTLSNSRRECYLTLVHVDVVLNVVPNPLHESIVVRMDLPVLNYFSSSNNSPVVAMLDASADNKKYTLTTENQIHVLTNDDLKRCSFSLENKSGTPIVLGGDDTFSVMIQLKYIDQKEMTNTYLMEQPKML